MIMHSSPGKYCIVVALSSLDIALEDQLKCHRETASAFELAAVRDMTTSMAGLVPVLSSDERVKVAEQKESAAQIEKLVSMIERDQETHRIWKRTYEFHFSRRTAQLLEQNEAALRGYNKVEGRTCYFVFMLFYKVEGRTRLVL